MKKQTNNNMNNITKRLNKLVKHKKIQVVVTKQGTVKRARSSEDSVDSYTSSYSSYDN